MNRYYLYKSNKLNKKYYVITPNQKKIYFGDSNYEDYTQHKDPIRKKNYLNRAKYRDIDSNNPETAGFWAKNILWNKKTLLLSIEDINKKYRIKIIY